MAKGYRQRRGPHANAFRPNYRRSHQRIHLSHVARRLEQAITDAKRTRQPHKGPANPSCTVCSSPCETVTWNNSTTPPEQAELNDVMQQLRRTMRSGKPEPCLVAHDRHWLVDQLFAKPDQLVALHHGSRNATSGR